MHADGRLPRARRDGLLEETVGEELLIYDQNSHTAHCLSPIATRIWRYCDGGRDVFELAQCAGVDEDVAADALKELGKNDLFTAEPQGMQSPVPGVSRREVIGRGVRYGVAAAAAPLIVSATAATPAMASSKVPECALASESETCCICTETSTGKGVFCVNKETKAGCEAKCKADGLSTFFLKGFNCA